MLGKAIFARRARQPATTPSSQPELETPVSSPSAFAQRFRKLKEVFKRSSSPEKDPVPQRTSQPRQELQATVRPQQTLEAAISAYSSQEPYLMTQRFDRRSHGPYPSLPPVVTSSLLFKPGEEAVATSAPSTPSSTFLADPTLLPPPRPIDTAPRISSPRSPRSPHASHLFQPEKAISATSTPSTAPRPTFSPKASILLAPQQSFDVAPAAAYPDYSSPLSATSTPSSSPCPTFSPNPSLLLAPPQFANTKPTTVYSQVSHTSQHIEDDPVSAKKIADLRATIANLQFKRDNYLADVQQALITNICPGVRVWQKKRDDQMKELEWAKAELAKKAEVRDIMEAMWREQREERWQVDDARVAVDKEWQEKLKRCEELEREVQRLIFQQEQWVAHGWRRRDWKSDGEPNSDPTSEVSPEQYSASPISLQQSSYGSNSLDNSPSQLEGARSTAPMSKSAKQGPFTVAARRQPSTQGSDSIESEMVGPTTRTHSRVRTSQPIRGMLDEFGQQTEGSGSRQGSDITYEDFA
ncbi:hypothetical protein FS837_000866 [Tulasnella sp. UAMH 9824]|nr:hypothetical protein FS837_000866 [Tulasnella sp. UAMH 9824]